MPNKNGEGNGMAFAVLLVFPELVAIPRDLRICCVIVIIVFGRQ